MLPVDKWIRLVKIIAQHGGLRKALGKLWLTDTLKEGKLMGCDSFGNKYYENQNYMLGRSRWVEYNPRVSWNYDASQVTPDWFGWLHYKTDRVPCEDWAKYCLQSCCWCHCWLLPHQENMSATKHAYYPYSTIRPKIHVWDGLSVCNRCCYETT
ncbi:probable NADH dehydrogenase [ubiquinone] 1 alpha subcomplex subunit 12 [Epargyreus clarus]|uniref:probable NADH dehydrogenase [ubiquinone] 1 alpha subcomplex subunit 12 n=1 Tax=Epargyreus clarus TaxID=520877 RepID=UPI003C2FE5CF